MEKDPNKSGLGNWAFEVGKKFDKAAIIAGVGIAAVGAVIVAPAVVAFGAATTAGSVVTREMTDRIQKGYNRMRASNVKTLGQAATKETTRRDQTLAA